MKKLALFLLILIYIGMSNALYADSYKSISLQASETVLEIKEKTMDGFSAVSSISNIRLLDFQSPKGSFIRLGIEGYSKNYGIEGQPHLPVLTKLIEIPVGASVKVVVKSYDTEIISLDEKCNRLKITPMQPSVSKNIPSELVEFQYDISSYRINEFSSPSPVVFKAVGTTRGLSFGRLKISPFRYNPVENSLQVLNNLSFDVIYENIVIKKVQTMRIKKISSAFKNSLSSIEKLPEVESVRKDALTAGDEQPLTYVIVAHEDFRGRASLRDFIAWKSQLGFNVIDVYTGELAIGSTKESIQSYLEKLYYSSNSPSYALFIGDIDRIPAWICEAPWFASNETHATDLYYFTYDYPDDGSIDYFPDVYYGRFPADNGSELDAIISKTLQYEKFQFASSTTSEYLDNYMFIVGDDEVYASSHGNAQINYVVNEYFPTIYKYPYIEGQSILSSEIIYNFNYGMGFVNYTGHCDFRGWVRNVSTYEFYFSLSDILNLRNKDKYGFVVGNCCESSKFDEDDSFGEMLIKQRDGGAIGYIGAANDTFWDEDFYWSVGEPSGKPPLEISASNAENHTSENTRAGVYDGLFYSGNNDEELYVKAGQIVYRGNLAVTDTASRKDKYYWEVYNLMGDPSLMPYLSDPDIKNVPGGIPSTGRSEDSGGICFIETVFDTF